MDYDEARRVSQSLALEPFIQAFIDDYQLPEVPGVPRQTVIFFPGGAGCGLKRSLLPHDPASFQDPATFESVWLDCGTLLGKVKLLGLVRTPTGYDDAQRHIVVAGETVRYEGKNPYAGFIAWCGARNIDLLVYPYDWRRSFDEVARFFVDDFIPVFRSKVGQACGGANPLARFTLIGHSQGGMLVNWLLRHHHDDLHCPGQTWERAITVATPFYGYANQMPRWYTGESMLNVCGIDDVVRIISSTSSFYTFNFLDAQTYAANAAGLSSDGPYSLPTYPCIDVGAKTAADDYVATRLGNANESYRRYPESNETGFDEAELASGRDIQRTLAAPIADAALSSKFFNVRGVRTSGPARTLLRDTPGTIQWGWIEGAYNAGTPQVYDDTSMPGDGVMPAWTARLLRTVAAEATDNVATVDIGDDEHAFIMDSAPIQDALADLLHVPRAIGVAPAFVEKPAVATKEQALDFIRDMHRHLARQAVDPVKATREQIRAYLAPYGKPVLEAIARRVFIEMFRAELPEAPPGAGRRSPHGRGP